jgi:hypothetical protein
MTVPSQPRQILCKTLSQKYSTQKRTGGVAQVVGPEFKPQCHKNKRKRRGMEKEKEGKGDGEREKEGGDERGGGGGEKEGGRERGKEGRKEGRNFQNEKWDISICPQTLRRLIKGY